MRLTPHAFSNLSESIGVFHELQRFQVVLRVRLELFAIAQSLDEMRDRGVETELVSAS